MNARKALIQVALQNGVSVAEIRRDIQEALDKGWNSPDPKMQEYWRKVPCKNEKPTIEEVLEHISTSYKS